MQLDGDRRCRRRHPSRSPPSGPAVRRWWRSSRRRRACGSPTRPPRPTVLSALVLGAADLGARALARAARGRPGAPLRALEARGRLGRGGHPCAVRRRAPRRRRTTRGIEAEALLARSLGLRGKACIHPAPGRGRQPGLPADRGRGGAGRATCSRRTTPPNATAAAPLVVQRRARRPRTRPAGAHDHGDDGRRRRRERLTSSRHRRNGAGGFSRTSTSATSTQPTRADDHRDRQHLVHAADAEHEPAALQRPVRRADALREAARQQHASRSRS